MKQNSKNKICVLVIVAALLLGVTPINKAIAAGNKSNNTQAKIENNSRGGFYGWYLHETYNLTEGADLEVTEEEYNNRIKELNLEIDMPYNSNVNSYIKMYTQKLPQRNLVSRMLALNEYYLPIFESALESQNLPDELKYLPVIESALNPSAVSRAGAAGLWQFMPSTGRSMGLNVSSTIDERYDPVASAAAATAFLKELHERYGDWSLAIAAYNCGPGNVNKALRRAGVENDKSVDNKFWEIYQYLPKETRGYVPCFYAAVYVMEHYDKHGISPAKVNTEFDPQTVYVKSSLNFKTISKTIGIDNNTLKCLNPQYLKGIIPGSKDQAYELVLPSETYAIDFLENFKGSEKKAKTERKRKSKTDINKPINTRNNTTSVPYPHKKTEQKQVQVPHRQKMGAKPQHDNRIIPPRNVKDTTTES